MPAQAKKKAAFRAAAALLLVAVLLAAAYWSARLAWADVLFRRNDLQSVRDSVRLDPGNERHVAWLAELAENAGEDPGPLLQRASALNPLDARVWIRRGLNAELQGDNRTAERMLLQAARVSRLFEPRWTLVNFYFRRGDESRFWAWVAPSFAMSYGDRSALFDLCWRMRPDPAAILHAMPPGAGLRLQFAAFLVAHDRADAAADVAERISGTEDGSERDALIGLCDRMLRGGHVAAALRVWNGLCSRKLVPFAPLDAEHAIANGSFVRFPSGQGFDWRVRITPAVQPVLLDSPRALRISLTGDEPENCTLLAQTVALDPEKDYTLRFTYRTSGIAAPAGLHFRVLDRVTPDLASTDWRGVQLDFPSAGHRTAILTLEYRRAPGSVRAEGWIALRQVALAGERP
jgi:hypothetical protein